MIIAVAGQFMMQYLTLVIKDVDNKISNRQLLPLRLCSTDQEPISNAEKAGLAMIGFYRHFLGLHPEV